MANPDMNVHIPALRAVNNVLAYEVDNSYVNFAIYDGILKYIVDLSKEHL